MKRYRFVLIFTAALLAFAVLLGLLLRRETQNGGRTQMNISIVLYESSSDRWTSLEQGIRQASGVLGIQTPLVNIASENDAAAQIAQIEREIEAGAQGLIIAANNSAELAAYIETLPSHLPVVFVDTGIAGAQVVGADNAEMGRTLGAALLAERYPGQTVSILAENLQRDSVRERFEAITGMLDENGIAWRLEETLDMWELRHGQMPGDSMLVALDTETLERAIDSAGVAAGRVSIYGIGGSDKIVHALERGGVPTERSNVSAICFPNEFNAGYIALMQLAESMGHRDAHTLNHGTDFVLVSADNLYDPDIERLLFPIIQ